MNADIVRQAPRTRCYVCGDIQVSTICHHCGRSMCSTHGPIPIPEGKYIKNPEFTELGLSQTLVGEIGTHCEDCMHYVRSFKWMIYGGVIGIGIGLIILFAGEIALGILSIFAGIGLGGGGWSLHQKWYQQVINDSRPPLPVIGKVESVTVRESICGRITLDDNGSYTTTAEQPDGKMTISFQLAPRDRERLEMYRKKFILAPEDDISFHAGFAVLQGAVDLHFDNGNANIPAQVNTIEFKGNITAQPFLSGNGTGRDNHWNVRYKYSFSLNDSQTIGLPIQIVPTLVREGDEWAIELVVQVNPKVGKSSLLTTQPRVEELILYAPKTLDKVERTQPLALVGSEQQENEHGETINMHVITWKDVGVNEGEKNAYYRGFYLRFKNKLTPSTKLNGRLRIRFDGTLSGLDDIAFFYPFGNKRDKKDTALPQRFTYVDIRFDLHLGSLRFQEIASAETQFERQGVIPDYRVLTALTNAISEQNIYVKRIVENPPRTNKVDAHIINRYWDVAGRFYDGVYPIDFHLVLTGEERLGSGTRSYSGKTRFDIAVQGTVTNEQMRDKVHYLRDQLAAIIDDTLDQLPDTLIETPSIINEESSVAYAMEVAANTSVASMTMPDRGSANRVSELHKRLDKLDEALLEGRITEERYQEMRERIENELKELIG